MAIYAVEQLSSADAAALLDDILREHPKPEQDRELFSALQYDSGLDRRYAIYQDEAVPRFAEEFHRHLEVFYGQVPVSLIVENVGDIRADNLSIDVNVAGGWMNVKPIVFPRRGPTPPRMEGWDPMRHIHFDQLQLSKPAIGRHEFTDEVSSRCESFSAQCEDFRVGQEWVFSGVVWLDPAYDRDTVVSVKVTAANLRGEVANHFPIPKLVQRAIPSDLIDLKTGLPKVPPHIQPAIDEAIRTKNFKLVEFDDGKHHGGAVQD